MRRFVFLLVAIIFLTLYTGLINQAPTNLWNGLDKSSPYKFMERA